MDKLSGLKKKLSVSMKDHHVAHVMHTDESENYDKHDASSNGNTLTSPIENTAHFVAQYLGFVEIKSPGLDEICDNVDKMYTQAKPFMKTLEKTTLKINKDGIEIGPKNEEIESKLFKFRRILYCGVDKQHRRVFSFNYQYGSRAENIHLHVIVCKTKEGAKNLAKKLAEIFREISMELHKKEKEDKRRHSENLSRSRGSSKSEPNMSDRLTKSDSNYSSSGASEVGSPGSPPSCGSDGMWECGVMTRRPPVCS